MFVMTPRRTAGTDPEAAASWMVPSTRRLRPPTPVSPAGLATWRATAIDKLTALLALPIGTGATLGAVADRVSDGAAEPQLVTLQTADDDIPCWLLIPPAERRLDAAVVVIAGHGPGIDALVETSPAAGDFHGGLAHKLAAAGFTVLCPELTSFGRRRTRQPDGTLPTPNSCQVDGLRGLLTGRPVLGRRVADTLAAIGAARALDGIDPTKVAVVGVSGGGAIALLAAALDDRIPAAIVGTFFSSFAESFGTVPHCICNAVPDLLTWFEMADLAAMIAPRRLIIEAGRHDQIFPIAAAEASYAELLPLWAGLDADPPDLVITDAGHQFLADDAIVRLHTQLHAQP